MDTTYQFISRFFKFMLSIKSNFEKIKFRNPNLGAYPCIVKTIKGRKFSRKSLVKAFTELMPEDEYLKSEQKELIDYLENITKPSEEGEI